MNADCPCGTNKPYSECCGLYIESEVGAPTPEALMRSRYSAYSLGNIDYIGKTMQGDAAKDFDVEGTKRWADGIKWLSLAITSQKMKTPSKGFVIFEATYLENGKERILREKSEFHFIKGHWYYVAGKMLNPHKGTS